MNIPNIESIKALNGRIFAMLTEEEIGVLNFYRDQGRKYGVSVSITNKGDLVELERAVSRQQADQILMQTNSLVEVKSV